MRGMNSASVDAIYLDPPFNSNHNYAAPIGSQAAGAEFKDTWTLQDVDVAWLDLIEAKYPALNRVIHAAMNPSDKSYLIYMAVRLLEVQRLLKPTGSIWLHCNQFASHYLKLVMDAIFGRDNFINEVVWNYGTPSGGRTDGKKPVKVHDCLLVYATEYGKHLCYRQYTPYSEKYIRDWFRHVDDQGRAYNHPENKKKLYGEQKNVPLAANAPEGAGDVWTWTALDPESKLMVSCLVGGRDSGYALEFLDDVKSRLANRVQLTTDGHKACLEAMEDAFGADVDYAQLVKLYGPSPEQEHCYSPPKKRGPYKKRILN